MDRTEVPPEREKELYCASGQTLELIAQRGYGVSITEDTPELSGHNCVSAPWEALLEQGGWIR